MNKPTFKHICRVCKDRNLCNFSKKAEAKVKANKEEQLTYCSDFTRSSKERNALLLDLF